MSDPAPPTNAPPRAPSDDPLIGRELDGRYRIVSLIARGGMGKVYRAEQSPLGREVALKVLDAQYRGDQNPEFQERFFLEAATCAKLNHPNTVTIFDYGCTEDDIYYIAMELLEGFTLQRLIRLEKRLPKRRALHIAQQIIRSLREAHAAGVIHRDLKPANVFIVDHPDEDDFVKVLDFGLVKELEDSQELTETGLFVGSPKYVAPEQIQGEEIDARADVYSLGVILYEMLTGSVPFDRPNAVNTLMAHVHDPVPPFAEIAPDLSPEPALEAVVLKAIAKEAKDRYEDMQALLVALRDVALAEGFSLVGSTDTPISGAYAAMDPARLVSTLPPEQASEPASGSSTENESGPSSERRAGAAFVMLGVVGIVAAIVIVVSLQTDAEPLAQSDPEVSAPASTPGDEETFRARARLSTTPSGAQVLVDDELVGVTPLELEWIGDEAFQELTFVFRSEGYQEHVLTQRLEGQDIELNVVLARADDSPSEMRWRPRMRARERDTPMGLEGYKAEPY